MTSAIATPSTDTALAATVRLAELDGGRIMIGGAVISGIALGRPRDLVTLVPQDPWLHTETIADNTWYGRPGAAAGSVQRGQGVTPDRFSPTTPASTSPIDTSLSVETDSPRATMPITAVPTAPMPVQTAYAGPTSSPRRARVSSPKLIRAHAAKPTVGHSRLKTGALLEQHCEPGLEQPGQHNQEPRHSLPHQTAAEHL